MTDAGKAPEALRAAIARDLVAVTPLASPARRALLLVPFAIALLVAAVNLFGLRMDGPSLGFALTWGASLAEMCLGLGCSLAALREAVPAMTLSKRLVGSAIGASLVMLLAVTWLTWTASPRRIMPGRVVWVWEVCLGATFLAALPPLALSAWLVARAYAVRPAVAGALYGLGAGLMSDAGWRLFCHFSDPRHVIGAHLLAVALSCVVGAFVAVRISKRRK